jgi:hypothetical protein
MPRGGSKRGEHRGNAKRRLSDEPEMPGDVMRDAMAERPIKHYASKVNKVKKVEARLEQAKRLIHMHVGDVRDMTPREVMLNNMHFFMQGAFDWQDHLVKVVDQPVTVESVKEIERAQREIERFRQLASDDAYKVAPYIHPRLAAVITNGNAGTSDMDVVTALLDDIDARQRDPRVIEHRAKDEER